jgi:NAD(P)-dependent dehydrogenase (short-subunit alcohol dehydrogenase family)
MSLKRLEGKTAIITGAASGIGKGVAELFVGEGANVVVADLNEEAGHEVVAELGDKTRFLKVDVTSDEQVKGMIDFAVSEFGQLDCLHNNAGAFGARGSALEIDADGFDFTFSLLVKSVFLGMKYAGLQMQKQGNGGSIVNTASISATTPGYGPHLYQSAKAAVLQLSKTVALEFAEFNVRVNCVSPGGVYTPLIGNAMGMDQETTEKLGQNMGAMIPMNRTGTPLDIARGVLFFCSQDAEFITAQNLIVDGGESTGTKYDQQGVH